MKYLFSYKTMVGQISIVEEDGYLTNIYFPNAKIDGDFEISETELIAKTHKQLCEYLDGNRKEFNIALNPTGSLFMKKVWKELMNIPYGTTVSYSYIAKAIGNPGASRAVGMANNRNPIPIIIPCHRVIGIKDKLVGYAGGLDLKTLLLNIESGKDKYM